MVVYKLQRHIASSTLIMLSEPAHTSKAINNHQFRLNVVDHYLPLIRILGKALRMIDVLGPLICVRVVKH